jgi:hypothetical protein
MKPAERFFLYASRLLALLYIINLAAIPVEPVKALSATGAPHAESARPEETKPEETKPKEKRKPIKVLFIGNSYTYTNNLPSMLKEMAKSAGGGNALKVRNVVKPGATLKMHWEDGEAARLLRARRWDYVVLQEQSLLPLNNAEMMYTYVRLFVADIKKVGAQPLLFITWARQNQPETQQALTEAYTRIAREVDASVAPVGVAWQNAAKANPKISLYVSDQSHPNALGSYVSACVFYSTIFGKSPMGLTRQFVDPSKGESGEHLSINEADARFLQQIAWKTVKGIRHAKPAGAKIRRGKQAAQARARSISPIAIPGFTRSCAQV